MHAYMHLERNVIMPCSVTASEVESSRRRLQPFIKRIRNNLFEKAVREANQNIFLNFRVRQAREIIRIANKIFSGNLVVAVSGGKDSLVALHLALNENPKIPVLYNNTTVGFPETLQYVKRLEKQWEFDLHITRCQVPFFKAVRNRGWATHEDRWCCKPYKDLPASEFLLKNGIDAEITGTTRTESIYRRSLKPFKLPKKEPQMIRIHPIYDWNYWEVWAYIRENNLPYNPLYDKGYRRIGCWCCPINGWTHYRRLKKTHPRLYGFLENFEPKHPQLQAYKARSDPKSVVVC